MEGDGHYRHTTIGWIRFLLWLGDVFSPTCQNARYSTCSFATYPVSPGDAVSFVSPEHHFLSARALEVGAFWDRRTVVGWAGAWKLE